ncbi:MAG: OmpA family protein [Cellulophaga sp.]|nr:OmpA family protein [Cellulophaga sp.]
MWTKKLILWSVILIGFNFLSAQETLLLTKKDSMVSSSWIFGVGYTIVDDSGDVFDNLLQVSDTWNAVPYPSRLSIGRYFKSGIGVEAIGAYTKYQEGNRVDGVLLAEDKDYYAIDTRVSYDLNKLIGQTGFFDPYIGAGIGYTQANDQGRGTYNAVIGFRTWFSDRFGLDFNSTGKWRMNSDATNHLQHAVGVVYQFGIEKGLTKKGEEKLALLQALEAENARSNDSIAAAKDAAEKATQLAANLAQEKKQQALAAQQKLEENMRQERKETLENAIKGLDAVYFDLNSSYLTTSAKNVLTTLAGILKENPNVVIEISSYTDSRGSNTYNMWLSDKRVKRTVDYLTKNGVPLKQTIGKAFGEEVLVNECDNNTFCSEEKHQENRRSEFKLIEY